MLIAAYFVGVALVGAALGAVVANLVFSASGPRAALSWSCVLCVDRRRRRLDVPPALLHHRRHRFGGAWTMIVGAMALLGDRAALAAAAGGQRLGGLSAESGAGPAVGADCVDRARA